MTEIKTKQNSRVAVISGGSGYLGSAIVRKLMDEDFVVVVITRSSEKKQKNSNDKLVHYFVGDITDEKSVIKIAEKVQSKLGGVSLVVHCASAKLIRKPILSLDSKDFEEQFHVNSLGAFNLFKVFSSVTLPNGVFVGITSRAIENGGKHSISGSYIPSKYALKGLLRVLAVELSQKSIRVYGVAPAFMIGGLNRDIPEKAMEFIKKKSLKDEITDPEEVAGIILDIVNNKAKYENGKSITVPGGKITDL